MPTSTLKGGANRLVDHLPSALLTVPSPRRLILHDGFARSSRGLVKERVDVDHIDLCLWAELAEQWRFKRIVLKVRKTQQVVALRKRREPVSRRLTREC